MKKYNEIFKLKKMLEDAHIPFDWIENWGYDKSKLEEMERIAPDLVERYQICYPMFASDGQVLSAIQGFGTYGAEQDLIEIMGLLTPEEQKYDCVVGHLTAKDVFERIQKHYNNKKGEFVMKKIIKVVDEDTLEMKEVEVEDTSASDEMLDTFANQLRSALNCEPEEFYLRYKDYKEAEAKFKEVYDPFKERLIKIHEETPTLPKGVVIGGTKLTYVSPSTRSSIDSKKLKEEEPEIAKKYTKTTSVGATIRLEEV